MSEGYNAAMKYVAGLMNSLGGDVTLEKIGSFNFRYLTEMENDCFPSPRLVRAAIFYHGLESMSLLSLLVEEGIACDNRHWDASPGFLRE